MCNASYGSCTWGTFVCAGILSALGRSTHEQLPPFRLTAGMRQPLTALRGFRETFNQATPVNTTLLKGVPPGAKFTVTLRVLASGALTVTASCNGKAGSSGSLHMDSSWRSSLLNFHGGVLITPTPLQRTTARSAS